MGKQERTPELITPLERAWLNLLRKALADSISGYVEFEGVSVQGGCVLAKRVIETIHCDVNNLSKTK